MRHLFRCLLKADQCWCFTRGYGSLSTRALVQSNQETGSRRNSHRNVSANRRNMSSASADETIFRSPRQEEKLPVMSLSDYMFSRFNKFGSKNALVSLLL